MPMVEPARTRALNSLLMVVKLSPPSVVAIDAAERDDDRCMLVSHASRRGGARGGVRAWMSLMMGD